MQQLGPYRLGEELGRGGMGAVYRAQDQRNGRVVALKVLIGEDLNQDQLERFRREAVALHGVEHPNLVRVFDLSMRPPRPYVAFEYVPGDTLKERILREGPLPWAEAVRVLSEIAAGVSTAHERNLLHRDIKPANVLLGESGAKLADFGLVKDFDQESLTRSGATMGTPSFMAPEQIDLKKGTLGPATDVYGLAGTLHYALTGIPPFKHATQLATILAVKMDQPKSTRSLVADVPPWLDAICRRGLAKQPAERYPSALSFRAALLDGEREPERPTRSTASAPLWAGLALGLALVAGGTWFLAVSKTDASSESATQSLSKLAEEKLEQGNLEGALADYESLVELDPSPRNFLNRGVVQADLGHLERALADCDRALELDPDSVAALERRAVYLHRLERDEDALADLNRAIALDAKRVQLFVTRGAIKSLLGDPRGAVEDYAQALELDPGNAPAHLNRGLLQRELGELEAAVSDFERAFELDPQLTQSHRLCGKLYALLGRLADAEQSLARAVECDPNDLDALASWAEVQLNRERYDEALQTYDRVLGLVEDPVFFRGRALCKAQLGRQAEAIADYDRSLELDPRSAGSYFYRGASREALRQDAKALEDYERALELNPPADLLQLLRQGKAQLIERMKSSPLADVRAAAAEAKAQAKRTELARALEEVDRLIVLSPENSSLHSKRGRVLAQLGRLEEALECLTRAVELDPENLLAFASRGKAHAMRNEYDAALADYDRALELDPSSHAVYLERGAVRANLGQYEVAIRDLDRALEGALAGAVDQARGFKKRAWCRIKLGLNAKAIEDYDRAIQLAPSTELLQNRGVAKSNLGLHAEAVSDFDRALELNPRLPTTYSSRGYAMVCLGRLDDALADYTRALELVPDDTTALGSRAAIKNMLGQKAEAIADFDRELELEPNWVSFVQRGNIKADLGRHLEALEDYERALERNPKAVEAYLARAAARLALGQPTEAVAELDQALALGLEPDKADQIRQRRDEIRQQLKTQ